MSEQLVYIAATEDAIKIGRSVDPETRVKDLSVGNPKNIKLVNTIDPEPQSAEWMERRLHSLLEEHGMRMNGEWFTIEAINFLLGWLEGVRDSVKEIEKRGEVPGKT
jgi:hypothetical protein